jgi:hypothetical protein
LVIKSRPEEMLYSTPDGDRQIDDAVGAVAAQRAVSRAQIAPAGCATVSR